MTPENSIRRLATAVDHLEQIIATAQSVTRRQVLLGSMIDELRARTEAGDKSEAVRAEFTALNESAVAIRSDVIRIFTMADEAFRERAEAAGVMEVKP